MTWKLSLAALAAVFPVSVHAQTVEYDCQAEKQLVLMSDNSKWNYNASDIDKDNRAVFRWKFVLERQGEQSTISHETGILDAVGVAGSYEPVWIAPGQFAFATSKGQNCLFTEQACGALIEISDTSDTKASFSLVPMGSVKKEDGSREIFQIVMLGNCKRSEVSQ